MEQGLDTYISQYDNILQLLDVNVENSDRVLNECCNDYNLFSFAKEPSCFKKPYNPSCIDIFLTNCPQSFQNSLTIETGTSDFHKMVISVTNILCKKQAPKIIQYRSYKNFDNRVFQREHFQLLKIDSINADLLELTEIFLSILDKHLPRSSRFTPANNSNFLNKNLKESYYKKAKTSKQIFM